MKRTKENMFEKRFQFALALLLKGGDTYIDIGKLHYRRATTKRLYERLKTTLDLMGIQYYNAHGSMRMRVPKPKELEEDKKKLANPNFVISQFKYSAPMVIRRPEAHAVIKMSCMHSGQRTDKSTIAKLINERSRNIIADDMIDSMVSGLGLMQMDRDNAARYFGNIIHKYVFDDMMKTWVNAELFANYMGYKKRGHP